MPAADPPSTAAAADTATAGARTVRDHHLAALLATAARGDATAFEAFFDATAGYARALARRMLHDADLEDALADAYFDAWQRAAQFDPARGSAVSWLLTIVHSRAIDRLRQRHTGAATEAAADDSPTDPTEDPAERLWRCQSQQRLHRALAALSPGERWVLGLAYFRDLPHGAIAQATGLPLGSVKSLILRAQHKLRERLID